ncbi:hypothetical protein FKP32DRAFT_1586440, partial [Trametes sanguinea]
MMEREPTTRTGINNPRHLRQPRANHSVPGAWPAPSLQPLSVTIRTHNGDTRTRGVHIQHRHWDPRRDEL